MMKKIFTILLLIFMLVPIVSPIMAAQITEVYVDSTKTIETETLSPLMKIEYHRYASNAYILNRETNIYEQKTSATRSITIPTPPPPKITQIKEYFFSSSSVEPGDKCAILLIIKDGTTILDHRNVNEKDILKYNAYFEGELNCLVGDPKIEKIKIGTNADQIAYAITFTVSDPYRSADLVGNFSVGRTKSAAKNATTKFDIALRVNYDQTNLSEAVTTANITTPNVKHILYFNSAADVEVNFGSSGTTEIGVYEVNCEGQEDALNVNYNLDYNHDLGVKYDFANLRFVNFAKRPSFNRVGTMYIYAEKGQFIYEVNGDGSIKEINGVSYDESYSAFKFRTRTLGSYIISDKELPIEVKEEPVVEAPVTQEPEKLNPPTGGN